mgnify:CR=1 FL=1
MYMTKNVIDNEGLCEKIMRQTDYSKEIAKEKLLEFDNNLMDVIRDYLKPKKKLEDKKLSTNQQIYKEIRNFMNEGSKLD